MIVAAVYGYARVSTVRQAAEGESLEIQRRQIEGYCLMHGLELSDVVIEEGVSGSVPVDQRPAGGPLLAKLSKGDIVIASKLDRLFRSALDALQVVEALKKRGIRLHLLDLGGDIAGNGLSKLFLTIAAAFAEAERDRIRERVATSKADQRARGRYLGGKVPFGYVVGSAGDLVEDQAAFAMRAWISELHAEGKPLRSIAALVTAKGFSISHQGIAELLRQDGKAERRRGITEVA